MGHTYDIEISRREARPLGASKVKLTQEQLAAGKKLMAEMGKFKFLHAIGTTDITWERAECPGIRKQQLDRIVEALNGLHA
jgi:hypothetical protein